MFTFYFPVYIYNRLHNPTGEQCLNEVWIDHVSQPLINKMYINNQPFPYFCPTVKINICNQFNLKLTLKKPFSIVVKNIYYIDRPTLLYLQTENL